MPMREISEALRLKAAGLSTRKIASSLGLGQSTVSDYLKRADRAGLSWPLPEGTCDADLEQRLYQLVGGATRRGLAPPDWAHVHRELRRKGVTLSLLRKECRAAPPGDGYGYSRFCDLYRRWEGRLAPRPQHRCASGATRQHHAADDRAFVDFADDTVEAVWSQALSNWIGAHVRMLVRVRARTGGAPAPHSSAACPRSWSATTFGQASPEPASTSRRSTGPMPISPPVATRQSFRRGPTSQGSEPSGRHGSETDGEREGRGRGPAGAALDCRAGGTPPA
nr:helix-turn-helix domain-containing protein [Mangrovicoccus sp. HB161399]